MGLLKFFSLKTVVNDVYRKSQTSHKLTDEERCSLQNCLLDIYRDIFFACEKYDIRPFLQGGTLLGKLRHNGFIPWDDDLDLGMFRADYEKFKKIFDRELGEKYLLRGPGCPDGATNRFIQVFKKGTYYKTAGMSENIPHHVYIDIFPIDFAPEQPLKRRIKGSWCNFLMAAASCAEFRETFTDEMETIMNATFSGKMNMKLRLLIGKLLSIRSLNFWYMKTDRVLRGKRRTGYCTSGTGRKHYLGELVKASVFYPLKKTEFEGCPAWIPNQSDLYLKNLYGDYMKIPDEKEREQHFIEALEVKSEIKETE